MRSTRARVSFGSLPCCSGPCQHTVVRNPRRFPESFGKAVLFIHQVVRVPARRLLYNKSEKQQFTPLLAGGRSHCGQSRPDAADLVGTSYVGFEWKLGAGSTECRLSPTATSETSAGATRKTFSVSSFGAAIHDPRDRRPMVSQPRKHPDDVDAHARTNGALRPHGARLLGGAFWRRARAPRYRRWTSVLQECPAPPPESARTSIVRDGDELVINGRKHWITGAGNVDCKIMILMGRTASCARRSGDAWRSSRPKLTLDRSLVSGANLRFGQVG